MTKELRTANQLIDLITRELNQRDVIVDINLLNSPDPTERTNAPALAAGAPASSIASRLRGFQSSEIDCRREGPRQLAGEDGNSTD